MAKEKKRCPKCSEPLEYDRKSKQWVCKACLLSAYLTYQAQKEAQQRYRQSQKGIDASKRYEQSNKGKSAREKYLKSDKYKQRRKEYSERLKESLRIARESGAGRTSTKETPIEERLRRLDPVKTDIVEFTTMMGHPPSINDVKEWAAEYNVTLSDAEAQMLLKDRNT